MRVDILDDEKITSKYEDILNKEFICDEIPIEMRE